MEYLGQRGPSPDETHRKESARVSSAGAENGLSRLVVRQDIAAIRRVQTASHLGKKVETLHRVLNRGVLGQMLDGLPQQRLGGKRRTQLSTKVKSQYTSELTFWYRDSLLLPNAQVELQGHQ